MWISTMQAMILYFQNFYFSFQANIFWLEWFLGLHWMNQQSFLKKLN